VLPSFSAVIPVIEKVSVPVRPSDSALSPFGYCRWPRQTPYCPLVDPNRPEQPPAHLRHLSTIMHQHLRIRGRYHDAETLHQPALATASAAGDQAGQLNPLNGLGHIHRRSAMARLPQAHLAAGHVCDRSLIYVDV
jgi:hypothetical protein